MPHWEESRFDNMKRADDGMRMVRKQIAQARREGKLPPRRDGSTAQAGVDESIFQRKFDEDKDMSDSELEEIEEQLTGQTTIRQLAEFKARALGDNETADKIRDIGMTHKELLEYIEDETITGQSPQMTVPATSPVPMEPQRRNSTQQS